MKKKKIKIMLEKACTDKVKVCTPKFCAIGCYDDINSEDYVVALNDVYVTYNNQNDKIDHKDSLCICDEYIVAFEPHVDKK